jgi:hypothetical protein
MRVSRIRISKKHPVKTLLKNFGVGGAENYEPETIDNVFTGIKLILENTGLVELEQVGKFLLKLSDDPEAVERALEEFEEWGL